MNICLELKLLKIVLPVDFKRTDEVLNSLKGMVDFYPNLWADYQILLIVPISVVS